MHFTLNHFLYLLTGVGWTIVLTACAFVLGSLAGFVVMLLRISRRRWVRRLSLAYIEVIQGTPLLILLFIIYFGLGLVGIELPALVAAAIALMINCSAFLGEIWRGCVEAVPRTQTEAAECLALTRWQSCATGSGSCRASTSSTSASSGSPESAPTTRCG